jgi:hypothetical protein
MVAPSRAGLAALYDSFSTILVAVTVEDEELTRCSLVKSLAPTKIPIRQDVVKDGEVTGGMFFAMASGRGDRVVYGHVDKHSLNETLIS